MNKTTEALKLADIEDLQDSITKALKKAFQLGQTYWQQADSESFSQNKKCDETRAKFYELKDEAVAAIREAQAEQEKQEPVAWPVDRTWFYSVLRYAEKNPDCFDEVAPDCVSLDSCDADTVIDALNAAPVSAKREWVDLTEGEQEAIYLKCNTPSEYTNAVIAAFKEKNK